MANVTTQTIRVDLSTDKVIPSAFTHQNDTARTLEFSMYNYGTPYTMTGNTVKFAYKSPIVDGAYTVITGSGMANGTVSDNKVTVTLPNTYTAISGVGMLTMIITPSSGTIRPVNIRLVVQKSADGDDVVAGASDMPDYLAEVAEQYYSEYVTADVQSVTSDVSNYITGTGKVSAQEFTWEQGAVKSSNGSNSDSDTRIRSTYAKMGNYIIYLKANEGYKFLVACYTGTSYSTYVGMYDGTSFSTTATWQKEMAIGFDRDLYTRIVIAKDDDSAIVPSDASNLVMYVAVDRSFNAVNVPIESKAVGDKINEISARTIRVMQYNVGKFRWGYVDGLEEHGLTEAQYKEKLLNYKKLFGKYHPDVLGLQECVMYMDKAQTHNTKNVLLNDVFSYVSPDSFYNTVQLETEICGCGAISNIDRLSVRDENDSYRTWFRLATLTVGTRQIRLASGALSSAATPQQRAEQLEYLIEHDLKNYEYAIITSDLNSGYRYDETTGELIDNNSLSTVLASAASYDFFPCQAMDAYWGATVTYVQHAGVDAGNIYSCLDNILCKGNIKIRNFEVLTDEYDNLASDHIPVIADLYVY